MSIIILQGANELAQNVYYEIETESEPLGVGGMGKVYKGVRVQRNTGVRTDVAVKFLFDDLPAHAIERARREASIQVHNENLIEMFGFIEIDEEVAPGQIHTRYHVVSELLKGVMLFDLLKGKTIDNSGEEIPFASELYRLYTEDKMHFALRIVKCVLSGVMALHDKGYIHRDIDPSNIMITHDGKVKLIDLGIAKPLTDDNSAPLSQHLTVAGQFLGKAAYAAPELVIGDVAHENRTTDLYAVGILFFQLVTGHLPFEGATLEVLDMQLHQKMPLHEITSKHVRKVIAKATAKKQSERYATASEFRVAVEQLEQADLNEVSVAAVLEEKTQMIEDVTKKLLKKPRKPLIVCAAVVLLLVVVGASVSFYTKYKHQQEVLRQQAEMELQEKADRLRALLQDSVIDNTVAEYHVAAEVGETIKTAGLITKEATDMLLANKPAEAQKALKALERVVNKRYRSSAEAAYLLGRLYYEREETDSILRQMKQSAAACLTVDNAKAFHYDTLAARLDPTCYQALYECGCDFLAGEIRTKQPESRDVEKAKAYFMSAYRYASSAGDTHYVEICKKRLRSLGVNPSDILVDSQP